MWVVTWPSYCWKVDRDVDQVPGRACPGCGHWRNHELGGYTTCHRGISCSHCWALAEKHDIDADSAAFALGMIGAAITAGAMAHCLADYYIPDLEPGASLKPPRLNDVRRLVRAALTQVRRQGGEQ